MAALATGPTQQVQLEKKPVSYTNLAIGASKQRKKNTFNSSWNMSILTDSSLFFIILYSLEPV
jgi:hypothetical protein